MKMYSIPVAFSLLLALAACTVSLSSEQYPEPGMTAERLQPCPSSPNCVCSEFTGGSCSIQPLLITEALDTAWARAAATVRKMGGTIVQDDERYLHATFTSSIFRFVDDFELRLDEEDRLIHLRSASRSGYWDFGVNRKRAEQFRTLFTTAE